MISRVDGIQPALICRSAQRVVVSVQKLSVGLLCRRVLRIGFGCLREERLGPDNVTQAFQPFRLRPHILSQPNPRLGGPPHETE